MDDLVQWLRDQLDEDERIARATTDRQPYDEWDAVGDDREGDTARSFWSVVKIARMERTPAARDLAVHIAAHDPARVLREIEAKRRVLDECAYWNEKLNQEAIDQPKHPYPCLGEILDAVNPILRALALPYEDRPGFREEWQPSE